MVVWNGSTSPETSALLTHTNEEAVMDEKKRRNIKGNVLKAYYCSEERFPKKQLQTLRELSTRWDDFVWSI